MKIEEYQKIVKDFEVKGNYSKAFLYQKKIQKKLESKIDLLKALEYDILKIRSDIHDGVQADISHIMDSIKTGHYTKPELSAKLNNLRDDVRNIALNLNPKYIKEYSFGKFIRLHLVDIKKNYPIAIEHNIEDKANLSNLNVRLNLYRCLQEALNNARKYARDASRIHVSFLELEDEYLFLITDDGKGTFDVEKAIEAGDKQGLSNIKSRCSAIGALCDIESSKDNFRIKITIPKKLNNDE